MEVYKMEIGFTLEQLDLMQEIYDSMKFDIVEIAYNNAMKRIRFQNKYDFRNRNSCKTISKIIKVKMKLR